jgi:16S rRNA processing protein RimM
MNTASLRAPTDAVVVGRVAGSYGVRGWLRIEPFNEPQDSVLLRARTWYLQAPAAPAGSPLSPRLALPAVLEVRQCRVQGAALVAEVAEIDVREVAESLRGCELSVSRTEFPPAQDDEFYWVDLIGCAVSTPEGVNLGTVESVDDHGAHPLLVVRSVEGRERLIPFVAAHVPDVDLAARKIIADWDPEF